MLFINKRFLGHAQDELLTASFQSKLGLESGAFVLNDEMKPIEKGSCINLAN